MTLKKIVDSLYELRDKLDENYCGDHKCCKYKWRFTCPLYNEKAEECAYYAIREILEALVEINNSMANFKETIEAFIIPNEEEE